MTTLINKQRKGRPRSYADLILLGLVAVFSLIWTVWGLKLFFGVDNFLLNVLPHFPFGSDWGRGELGDFLGGGLTGATLLLLFHSLTVQARQLSIQQADTHEAGVFRTFQALRSEVEGISVRIVSKYLRVKRENPNRGNGDKRELQSAIEEEPFSELLEKYQKGDKTVFLRFIQKFSKELRGVESQLEGVEETTDNDNEHTERTELKESLERFRSIMDLLEKSLKEKGDDFSDAIRSTEIFVTYLKLQDNCSKVRGKII